MFAADANNRWPDHRKRHEGEMKMKTALKSVSIKSNQVRRIMAFELTFRSILQSKLTRQSLLVAAVALGMSGIALADSDCSLKTLRGTYVLAAQGYNIVGGAAQPFAVIETIEFNGDGTLSAPRVTLSQNGAIVRILPPGVPGSYTVAASCDGTMIFPGAGVKLDIFVSPKGDTIWIIRTDLGTVLQGTATRVSELKLADRDRH